MKFLLDLQALQSASRGRGIGRYTRGLAQAILKGRYGSDACILFNLTIANGETLDEAIQFIRNCNAADRVHLFRGLTDIAGVRSPNSGRLYAAEALYDAYVGGIGVDLIHVASPFEGFGDDTVVGWTELSRLGPARAVTVYDLIPFEAPEIHLADPVCNFWYRRRYTGLTKADIILAISEHTRQVVIAMLKLSPDRVVNIGADADPIFRKVELSPQANTELLARYGISKPFVMHTGILEGRKNVETLIRAFALLPPEMRAAHQVVLVADATERQMEHMRGVARDVGLDPACLVFAGFVPDKDLVGFYSVTRAAVMPSLMEGFGLPLLEAMRCGAPVLGSNRTSIPEVVGNREYLFDPEKPLALTEKLLPLLTDAGCRQRAIAHSTIQEKRFSWESSATRATEAFKEAVARRQAHPRPQPKGSLQYILIPPKKMSNDLQVRTNELAEILKKTGMPIIFDHVATAKNPDLLRVSGQQRLLMISDPSGLDAIQCDMLTLVPAIVLSPNENSPVPMSPEWLYAIEGYQGLLRAKKSGLPTTLLDALNTIFPNVLGTIRDQGDLANKIETIFENHPLGAVLRLLPWLHELELPERIDVATAASENHAASPAIPRLLVDISELVHRDSGTGIQRVVKNVLKCLLTEPNEFRVEPVYRDGNVFRYARQFTLIFLDLPPMTLSDAIVDFFASDTFFGLDLDPHITPAAVDALLRLRRRGGSVNFLVHDLLPLLRPDWFPDGTEAGFDIWFRRIATAATRIITVSQSVEKNFAMMLDSKKVLRTNPLELTWCHNGSDFVRQQSEPALELQNKGLSQLAGQKIFLTVGTIEPRKGIGQLLDAADALFSEQDDVVFVIVGRKGWHVEGLIERIQGHREFDKRIFWFGGGINDELLTQLYRSATAVLLPSEAEGFGLPLVEAARHGTPIIARDIPVFREIGGKGAYFFKAETGTELASALRNWLELNDLGRVPKSTDVKLSSWRESTAQLLDILRGRTACRMWVPKSQN